MDPAVPSQPQQVSQSQVTISPPFNIFRLIIIIFGIVFLIIVVIVATNYLLNGQTQKQDSLIPSEIKNDITTFIKTSLKPSLIHADFEIQQTKPKQGAMNQSPNQFTVSLNNGNVVGISAAYNKQLLPENRSILITLPQVSTPSATLTAQYLTIKPAGTWKCNSLNLNDKGTAKAAICENFWTDSRQIKHGVGAINLLLPASQNTSIFACELYPQSPTYSWKSCSIYFSH